MSKAIRIGILTPSSNTALEPLTSQIIAGLNEVSVHFSRFTVTEISISEQSFKQFDDHNILAAAELLAHAKVDVIGWSGTSASWLGFDFDENLCRRIREKTGIPATTSVLALNELLEINKTKRLGLVSPYLGNVQEKIIENYKNAGIEIVSEQHLSLQDNFSFATVTEDQIMDMIRTVAKDKPDAITTLCTNMRGPRLAEKTEKELGIPLYDSIATVTWKALKMAGYDTRSIRGWGGLFGC